MTDQDLVELGPAFARYLGRYRDGFLQERTATHFGNYCRGLLSDLPRKSVEPRADHSELRPEREIVSTVVWAPRS